MRPAIVLMSAGLTVLASCSSGREALVTDSDSTGSSGRFERQQGESELATRLDAVRAELDSLRRDATALGPKLRSVVTPGLAAAEVRRDSAQVRLGRLRTTGEAEWRDVREGIAVMLDSLEVNLDRIRQDLRSSG